MNMHSLVKAIQLGLAPDQYVRLCQPISSKCKFLKIPFIHVCHRGAFLLLIIFSVIFDGLFVCFLMIADGVSNYVVHGRWMFIVRKDFR